MAANKKKRTTAQRRAAAKAAWDRRRAEAAMGSEPEFTPPPAVELPRVSIATPTTATVTQDGEDFVLSIYQDGSSFRHKLSARTLRLLALDALRMVG